MPDLLLPRNIAEDLFGVPAMLLLPKPG